MLKHKIKDEDWRYGIDKNKMKWFANPMETI